MSNSSPVDDILEFLRRNKFTKAEAALKTELGNRPDINGILRKLKIVEEDVNGAKVLEEDRITKISDPSAECFEDSYSGETSGELIVKEVECGEGRNGPENKWRNCGMIGKQRMVDASVGTSDNDFTFFEGSDDTVLDLYPSKYCTSDGENRISKVAAEPKHSRRDKFKLKEPDRDRKLCDSSVIDNSWSGSDVFAPSSSENWKGCSVETIFPLSGADALSGYEGAAIIDKRGGKWKPQFVDIGAEIKGQVDVTERAFYSGKTLKNCSALEFHAIKNEMQELPRLAPVRLKSEDKCMNIQWEEKYERGGEQGLKKILSVDNPYVIGSLLDMPFAEEIDLLGKRPAGGSWLSMSEGIIEGTSDLLSGFAIIGDGLSESVDFPNEYWDSDEYKDNDDIGYTRQPIEDEAWFLAHEIDYPSDNEKGTGPGSYPNPQERERNKDNEDDQSFTEEDSYFSGEQFFKSKNVDRVLSSGDCGGLCEADMFGENEVVRKYNGRLMDEEELNLICSEPLWQGFLTQTDELIMLGNGTDDQRDLVRSIGIGISSDAAELGSEARESLAGDIAYFRNRDARVGGSEQSADDLNRIKRHNSDIYATNNDKGMDGGFSFPPPREGQSVETSSKKSLWSNKANRSSGNCESLLLKSLRDDSYANAGESEGSSPSSLSNAGYAERELVKKDRLGKAGAVSEDDPEALLEDEEAAAVQEQVKQIKAQEEEFETFNLKIVHRKNRTGFEEDKNFHCNLNSIIAGRYHITEYLGSAAFSKAIQAHDLHTGMDVCVKIIKNNKDFFDQSLDEIKLLKYVNKHDPADKYHLLRLYDYFYYQEHLLIVCELLKANLYEFQKFNRESGGEVYFTMPRLQSIAIQCLEALQFLHGLGLIHCDLKPENILVKSYSRCEVKVIDLGSSCFETDNLCTYVQSRSYRAPEVILGLPYDKKIDIWSLGCILAELCTGNVLFQNDSPATLLARVIGIISLIEAEMLAKGRDTHKYFTKNHMLYERNQESNRLEYLIPKKSSIAHRLPMGDEGFIDFVAHLLQINPRKRPCASKALKHPWLQYPYEPLSS